ncbi:hypothetical protein H0H92_008478 [Tricholoma furcatifolium]|nr:hypothetical protein H0H92_008478 [Tricholoma furcatifolium]
MRPLKRRKVATPSLAISTPTKPSPAPIAPVVLKCISCHRSLNAAQGLLVICARCAAASCAICTRTCTACPSSDSIPPTPYLTRSPTPTAIAPAPTSPRPALASLAPNRTTNASSNNGNRGEKRRVSGAPDEQEEDIEAFLTEWNLAPGCGRIVCKKCCVENKESGSVACHDCMVRY